MIVNKNLPILPKKECKITRNMTDKMPLLLEPRQIYDRFIVGVKYDHTCFIYDADKIINFFINEAEGTQEEKWTQAIEHFEHNISGSYLGEGTPIFITRDLHGVFPQVKEENTRLKETQCG